MSYQFNTSKYTKYYFNLISFARGQNRSKKDSYFESHHIIPKSLGGNNSKSNKVLLTAREHYICHLLLVRMVAESDTYRMVNAIRRFQTDTRSSKEFENIRRTVSIFSRGEYNPSFGKIWIHNKHTQEILYIKSEEFDLMDHSVFVKGLPFQRGGHKNSMWINNGKDESVIDKSDSLPIGWVIGRLFKPSEDQMKKISKARHTPEKDKEHSQKMSGSKHVNFGKPAYTKGRIWVHNKNASKMIDKSNLDAFLSEGWSIGRLKN